MIQAGLTLGNVLNVHRTLRINYGWTQTTPKAVYLDPAWNRSVPIWPGMVAMKTLGAGGPNYTLINGVGYPAGLIANYIGGDGVDELAYSGINAMGVWVLGPDAEFQVLAPAFDASLAWTDPGNGTDLLISARTVNAGVIGGLNGSGGPLGTFGLQGQLVPAGTAGASVDPIALLISVDSATQITIGGLLVRAPGVVG